MHLWVPPLELTVLELSQSPQHSIFLSFIGFQSLVGGVTFCLMDFVKPEAEMFSTCRLYRERWKRKVGSDIWTDSAFYIYVHTISFSLLSTLFWTCSEAISKPSQRIFGKMDLLSLSSQSKDSKNAKRNANKEPLGGWFGHPKHVTVHADTGNPMLIDTRARSRVSFCVVVNLPSSRQRHDRVWFVHRQTLQCQTPVYKNIISGVFTDLNIQRFDVQN